MNGELAIVERLQPPPRRRAGEGLHARPRFAQFQAQRLPGAGQPRLDGADRDAERKRDLFVAEAVDLAQHDRRPLVERQMIERLLQPVRQLLLRQHAIGRRLAARQELAVRGDVLIERHLIGAMAPPPEAVAVARLVDGDPVDPGAQARLAAEAVDGAEDAQEDFLRQVERFVAIASRFIASWTTIRWCSDTSSAQAASSPAAQRWMSAASRPPTSDQPATLACFTASSTIAS